MLDGSLRRFEKVSGSSGRITPPGIFLLRLRKLLRPGFDACSVFDIDNSLTRQGVGS